VKMTHQASPCRKTLGWIAKGTTTAIELNQRRGGLDAEEEMSTMIERALFEGPCKCCGDPDHGVFTRITGKEGKERLSVACATLETDEWKRALESALASMRFKASFDRFSEANDNDIGRLQVAMRQFIKHGEGKHMHYLELIDFDSDLQRYRRCMYNQKQFKRCLREDKEEELSQDSDEESRC